MALRDIFDNDPRSKEQLRKELIARSQTIFELTERVEDLSTASIAARQESEKLREQLQAERLLAQTRIAQLSESHAIEAAAPPPEPVNQNAAVTEPTAKLETLGMALEHQTRRAARLLNLHRARVREFDATNETLQRELNKFKAQTEKLLIERAEEQRVSEQYKEKLRLATNSHSANGKQTALSESNWQAKYSEMLRRIHDYRLESDRLKKELADVKLSSVAQQQRSDHALKGVEKQMESLKREMASSSAGQTSTWQINYYDLLARLNVYEAENARLKKAPTSRSTSQGEDTELRRQISELQDRLADWKRFHEDREATLAAREAQLKKRENTPPPKSTAKKNQLSTNLTIPVFTQEPVLAWMFSGTHPQNLQVTEGYLHLMGDGPWDHDVFGRLLETQEFTLWQIPDAEVAHLVVGRNNWNEDALLAQIEARHGQSLRIYSQEMWFAAMATGRDPFGADNPELLQAFAADHEALQFLIGRGKSWPDEIGSDFGGWRPPRPPLPPELGDSPMHLMGYRVGKTSPHSEDERHEILNVIFSAKTLLFDDDCSPTYRADWGTPKSAQRLYRMALHIKFLVNLIGDRKSVARQHWIDDLAWLKKTYFRKTVHAFQWPSTHVP